MPNNLAYIRPVPGRDDHSTAVPREQPIRVLIVEDQEESAHNLSALLQMDGFIVSRAPDGPTALDAARSGMIDAVVLDVRLPGIDGFEVCKRLREDSATADLVIVMLTGLDDTQSKIEGLGQGADDYLVKPVASRELGARLRRQLEARQTQARQLQHRHEQATGEVVTAICHDIGNSLTSALGRVDMLLLTRPLTPDVRRELDECQRHLIRIGRILARPADRVRRRAGEY